MYLIPQPDSTSGVADWTEFHVALDRSELSKPELYSYIEKASGDEPKDDFVDSIWLELIYRQKWYGDNSPYKVNGNLLQSTINWRDVPEYMACLIFALEGNEAKPVQSGALFEQISAEAISSYVNGPALVVGHPVKTTVKDIADNINETFRQEFPRRRQDRNLDIIAWKPFCDKRCSQIILLIQCAAGFNYQKKLKELNPYAWGQYIRFACQPTKGFSIPVVISDKTQFDEASYDAGIIFDRTRIYRNITITNSTNKLKKSIIKWCEERLQQIL